MATDCSSIIYQIKDVISQITTYTVVCSIVGSFLTILTFTVFKNIRTYSTKIICFTCACIVGGYTMFDISNLDWITGVFPLCIIVAFLTHFFFLADFCWTFCIAFNFYQMIVKRNREVVLLEKWYHLGSWGVPAVIVIVVGACQMYGLIPGVCGGPPTCYITDQYVVFGAFFLPGVMITTANVILFYLIGREIQETLAGAPKTDQRDRKQEFRVYLSIFISIGVSWIFGYIESSIPEPVTQLIFHIIFSIMTPAQGILIFLSHCMNAKVAMKWMKLIGKIPCCPCCNFLYDKLHQSTTQTTQTRSGGGSRSANSNSANSANSHSGTSRS